MKKMLMFLLMILSFITSFGCHGSVKSIGFVLPSEFDTTKNIELTFWSKNDTNITQKRIYEKAISDFETLYPNVKITMTSYTNYGDIYNKVITNIATNTTPNICISYPDHVATYLKGENIVVPLDTLMKSEKYGFGGSELKFDSVTSDEMIEKFLYECNLNGYFYGVPFMRSTEACYINKTYVESLGYELPEELTWDFVWEVSEKAMEEKKDGQVLIPFIYKSTDNMMIQMLAQKNAGYSTAQGEVQIFNDTTTDILKTIALHSKSRCFSTFKISSYPGNFLNANQCIFAIDSTAGATWMGSDAPLLDIPKDQVAEFETEVMVIPQYDTKNPKMISQGPSLCIFNKEDPQEVLASWLFTQFLLTNEIQIAYSQTEGYIPVTKKALNSSDYQDYLSRGGEDNNLYYDVKIKASKLLLDNIDNTFVTPVFNGSTSLREAAGQMIENVVKSVRKKEEVNDEYMAKLYNDIISLFRLDQIERNADAKPSLGKMPSTSIALISIIGGTWVLIGIYLLKEKIKIKRKTS